MNISESLTDLETYSSTKEVLIGTWEGHLLYRKVFSGTATSQDVTVDCGIDSNKTRIMKFCQKGANTSFGSDYYTASDDRARCWHLGTRLYLSFGSSYPNRPVMWSAILEYVKD